MGSRVRSMTGIEGGAGASGRTHALAVAFALAILGVAVMAGAAEPPAGAPAPEAAGPRETVFSLTVKGGWLMIPIGICSVVILTWTIERLISLRRVRIHAPELLDEIFTAMPARGPASRENVAEASALCQSSDTLVGRVLLEGIQRVHRDEAHVETVLEEAAAKEIHILKRKLRPFEVCVAVAPLLGLLGTIFGMIRCFERATIADTAARAETLASGIYEALVTTAAGLCVAIPGLLLHHYFLGRVDRTQDLIEESATAFLDHYYGAASAGRHRSATANAGAETEADGGPQPSTVSAVAEEGDGGAFGADSTRR